MENAADALKMAFAVFVFVIAITSLFIMVSKVKTTSDIMFYYNDKTNFHEHTSSSETNRIVKVADIVATLYRYYKESVAVTVVLREGHPEDTYYFDLGYEQMGEGKPLLVRDGTGHELLNLSTQENVEKNLGEFINRYLITNHNINDDTEFRETFTEIPTSGIYSTGTDGSEITLSAGGKKVYITYTIQ